MSVKLAIQGGSKVRTAPFPAWPVFGSEEEEALLRVLRSGKWGRMNGTEVPQFEEAFGRYQDCSRCVCVVNGTVALRIALQAAGVGEGDEVIVPPYTFIATASAVLEVNAAPVFVDIEPDTYNLDPAKIEAALTDRTRAIVPVHFAGHAARMDEINAIAARHKLVVIEDAAHAHGASYKGRKCGSLAKAGCFSFQASKNLNSGEGGAITTNDPAMADMCHSLHHVGRSMTGAWYEHVNPGGNYRMTEFQAALLNCQLARLEEQTARREANGLYLNRKLAEIPGIRPMARGLGETRHSYHLYMFRYDPAGFDGAPRASFLAALDAEGIPCSLGYGMPLYRQELFAKRNFRPFGAARRTDLDYSAVSCPVCEKACSQEAVWLFQTMLLGSQADMDDIVRGISKVYDNRKALAR